MTDLISTAQITSAMDLINAYMSGGFLVDFVTVMVANIVLSGDNAVVIALAARSLPPARRVQGIVFGTVAAIFLRIILTYFATMLLNVPYMKLCGGLLILGIAVKLLLDKDAEPEGKETSGGLLKVIGVILLADLVMSVDNVLAVAGARQGQSGTSLPGAGPQHPHRGIRQRHNLPSHGALPVHYLYRLRYPRQGCGGNDSGRSPYAQIYTPAGSGRALQRRDHTGPWGCGSRNALGQSTRVEATPGS